VSLNVEINHSARGAIAGARNRGADIDRSIERELFITGREVDGVQALVKTGPLLSDLLTT
jgi:hypothetical protein